MPTSDGKSSTKSFRSGEDVVVMALGWINVLGFLKCDAINKEWCVDASCFWLWEFYGKAEKRKRRQKKNNDMQHFVAWKLQLDDLVVFWKNWNRLEPRKIQSNKNSGWRAFWKDPPKLQWDEKRKTLLRRSISQCPRNFKLTTTERKEACCSSTWNRSENVERSALHLLCSASLSSLKLLSSVCLCHANEEKNKNFVWVFKAHTSICVHAHTHGTPRSPARHLVQSAQSHNSGPLFAEHSWAHCKWEMICPCSWASTCCSHSLCAFPRWLLGCFLPPLLLLFLWFYKDDERHKAPMPC